MFVILWYWNERRDTEMKGVILNKTSYFHFSSFLLQLYLFILVTLEVAYKHLLGTLTFWIKALISDLPKNKITGENKYIMWYDQAKSVLKQHYEMWWERKNFTFHFFSSYIYVMTLVVTISPQCIRSEYFA